MRLFPYLQNAQTVLRTVALLALLAAISLPAAVISEPALAQSSIKVVVNGSAITSYDISNRTRFLKLISRGRAGQTQAVEELINEQLKFQEAKRRNVTASDADVDRAYAGIARNAKLTPGKLTAALKQQGVNPDTLKTRIRADLVWGKLVRADARTAVNVTEQEVIKALGQDGGEEAPTDTEISEYTLQPILFVVPKKASNNYRAQRKREAESFRNRITSCDQTLSLAKGLRDVAIKPVRRANEQELGELAEEIAATSVGKATRPRTSPSGWELFAVCTKKAIRGTSKAVTDERIKMRTDETQRFAQKKLRDLKSEAMIERR